MVRSALSFLRDNLFGLVIGNPISQLIIVGLIGYWTGLMALFFALYIVGAIIVLLYRTRGLRALYRDMLRVARAHPIRLPVNAVLIITLVILLHSILTVTIPITNTGWTFYALGENTNIITKPLVVKQAPRASWVLYARTGLAIVGWAVIVAALPLLAYIEERIFRFRVTDERSMWVYSALFGLLHLLPGAPISACIALMGAGYCFAYLYRYRYRHACEQFEVDDHPSDVERDEWAHYQALTFTTAQHYCYNLLLLTFLGLSTYL